VMFGSPETTPGGRALKFYSSVRLDIRRIESIKDGMRWWETALELKLLRTSAHPHSVSASSTSCTAGDQPGGLSARHGVELGILKKSGAWFTYDGEQLGQGREKAKESWPRTPSHGRPSASGRFLGYNADPTSLPLASRP